MRALVLGCTLIAVLCAANLARAQDTYMGLDIYSWADAHDRQAAEVLRLREVLAGERGRVRRLGRLVRKQRRSIRTLLHASPVGGHWLERAFLCLHAHEGSWAADTGNGYHGGLQMNKAFQRTYGREFYDRFGTANNWPASVQIAVGIHGWLKRGFQPWPTRRYCGL